MESRLVRLVAKRFMQRQRISSNETFFVQSHERILLESWRHWCILFLELHQMDVGEISSNEDLYEKVYIHDITKWFCCGKKRTLKYHLMKSDHRTVASKVL